MTDRLTFTQWMTKVDAILMRKTASTPRPR